MRLCINKVDLEPSSIVAWWVSPDLYAAHIAAGCEQSVCQATYLLQNGWLSQALLLLLQAAANAFTIAHNAQLAALLPEFAADHLDASIILFNFEAFSSQAGTRFGITDLTTPCYNSSAWLSGSVPPVCANPGSHAYWDEVHPTARVHELWGQAVAAQLVPYASATSSITRKLLAQEYSWEGSQMGSSRVFGLPL